MTLLLTPMTRPRLDLSVLHDIAEGLASVDAVWQPCVDTAAQKRASVRLLATEVYEVWILRWRPGSSVTPHDHGDSHGVVHVLTGELTEVRWHDGRRVIHHVNAGTHIDVPLGVVHDVISLGDRAAASIHVYSPPLTSMGFYDHGGRNLVKVEPIESEIPVLSDDGRARALHPSGG